MLIKQVHLRGIKAGNISLLFRKWAKPAIKKGTLLKTSIGLIKILDITEVDQRAISQEDAVKAGSINVNHLLKTFPPTAKGNMYKIQVKYHGPNPRIDLRNDTVFTNEAFAKIRLKLERMDTLSRQGAWTKTVLQAINDNPRVKTHDHAQTLGVEKDWLKPNIRKLKNLGLTVSHEVGYSISPRGQAFLAKRSK